MAYQYTDKNLIKAAKEICAKENIKVKEMDSGAICFVAKSSFLLGGDGKNVLSPYQKIHKLAEIETKIENAEKEIREAQARTEKLKAEKEKFGTRTTST